MKLKSILSLVLVLVTFASIAQTGNLRRAKANFQRFSQVKEVGNPYLGMSDLKAAERALEKATEHDRTSPLAETWIYYALVNANLALLDTTETAKEFIAKAEDAREKAFELGPEESNAAEIENLNTVLAQYALNEGVGAWERQDFKAAYQSFDRGSTYIPQDTTLLYYAGLAAIHSQDYGKALEKYTQLVPLDSFSNHRQIILDVSKIHLMQSDTAQAIHYANLGRKQYPDDGELAIQYIELNLMAGNEEEVIDAINEQAVREPDNKTLQYYLGIAYNAINETDKAEAAYQRALEIDPNYLDAHINLGGLILNRGIDQWNRIHNDRDMSKEAYEAEIQKAHAIFDEALPFLEKAVQINGESRIALSNLHKYYTIKENEEKAAEIQARIEALR